MAVLATGVEPAAHPTATPHPVSLYLARLAPGSRRSQAQILGVITGWLGGSPLEIQWGQIRYPHVQAVRVRLADRYAATTANKGLSAIRGVLREGFRLGWISAEDYHRARDVEPVSGARCLRGRALDLDEVTALYRGCDANTNRGVRDAALLSLCLGAGLRRAEAAGLRVADFDADGQVLTVLGKGGKQRRVLLGTWHVQRITRWVDRRGSAPGRLLEAISRTDRILGRGLSDDGVASIVRRLVERAGIPSASPHDLRRTYVSWLLDAGADLATVQRLVGHASPATTSRYDRRGERAARDAAELLVIAV